MVLDKLSDEDDNPSDKTTRCRLNRVILSTKTINKGLNDNKY